MLLLNTGSVIIKSDPVDAKALIDGNEVGNTPVTITDLKPGMQTVEIKMEGYENWSESVEIIPGNEIVIAAALQMKTGSVCINSEPTNAIAIIDGKEIGNTPVTITELESGTYNVEVKIDGYVDWKQSLDVTPDKEIAIDAKLQIKTGTVTVNSEPTNAKVMIEGKDVGTTPVTMADLTPGTFNVEIMMEGYEDWG